MYYRPKAAAQIIGIGESTLRAWSHEFADLLSPGARPGTAARRYSDQDLALLKHARVLLDRGLTFDQAGAQLQRELGGLATSLHFIGDAQRVADLEATIEALDQVIAAKDDLILVLRNQVEVAGAESVTLRADIKHLRILLAATARQRRLA